MANKLLVDDAESTELLPHRSAEYVDDGDLAKFVAEALAGLDLSEIGSGYSEGRRAYAPRHLLALWIYGYATGVNSVRTLSERCRYDLPPERDTLEQMEEVVGQMNGRVLTYDKLAGKKCNTS